MSMPNAHHENPQTRSSLLRQRARAFCSAFLDLASNPPKKILDEHFTSIDPQITKHGPAWANKRLPFLGKTFSGRDGCLEYFKLLSKSLNFIPNDATFPPKNGFIVDDMASVTSSGGPEHSVTNRIHYGSPIHDALTSLVVGDPHNENTRRPWLKRRPIDGTVYPAGPNTGIVLHQNKPCTPQSEGAETSHKRVHKLPATGGYYADIYNPADGVVIAQDGAKPGRRYSNSTSLTAEELPLLRHWSGVTYVVWQHLHARLPSDALRHYDFDEWIPQPWSWTTKTPMRQMLPFLNYVIIQALRQPPEALQIMASCLGNRNFRDCAHPSWEHRQTFPVGHWSVQEMSHKRFTRTTIDLGRCYYALLATPGNRGIAWLLAQHKRTLGRRVAKSVTDFWGDDFGVPDESSAWVSYPNLIWEIVEDDTKISELKEKYEGAWIHHHDPTDLRLSHGYLRPLAQLGG